MPYNIGDIGPAGGFIFATPNSPGNPTQYYFEAAKEDILASTTEPPNSNTLQGNKYIGCGYTAPGPVPPPGQNPSVLTHGGEFGWYQQTLATTTGVGQGALNTQQIVQMLTYPSTGNPLISTNSVAAWDCWNYSSQGPGGSFNDWFLGSLDEMLLMFENIGPAINNMPSFFTDESIHPFAYWIYWTSSTPGMELSPTTNNTLYTQDLAHAVHSNAQNVYLVSRCQTYTVRPIRRFTDDGELTGCMDTNAWNYDPSAINPCPTCCLYPGCPDITALNYLAGADGCIVPPNNLIPGNLDCCDYPICGCMDNSPPISPIWATVFNYDPLATADCNCDIGGSDMSCCTYSGCTSVTNPPALNYCATCTLNCDGTALGTTAPGWDSCCEINEVPGCTDSTTNSLGAPWAQNYNANATHDCNVQAIGTLNPGWNSCCTYIHGCTDPTALNYDPLAYIDDGSCDYANGCPDSTALNYCATCIEDCANNNINQINYWNSVNAGNMPGWASCCRYDTPKYNYRDGSAGLPDTKRIKHYPLAVPGLAGSTSVYNMTSFTSLFGHTGNHGWDSIMDPMRRELIGFNNFSLKIASKDAMGNSFLPTDWIDDPNNPVGYTITIYNMDKTLIGKWKYDKLASAQYSHSVLGFGINNNNDHKNMMEARSCITGNVPGGCSNIPYQLSNFNNNYQGGAGVNCDQGGLGLSASNYNTISQVTEGQNTFGGDYTRFITLKFEMQNGGLPQRLEGNYKFAYYGNSGFYHNHNTNYLAWGPAPGVSSNWNGGVNPDVYTTQTGQEIACAGSTLQEFVWMDNRETATGAYIKLEGPPTQDPNYQFADINGNNTDLTHLQAVCDETHGQWLKHSPGCGYQGPGNSPGSSYANGSWQLDQLDNHLTLPASIANGVPRKAIQHEIVKHGTVGTRERAGVGFQGPLLNQLPSWVIPEPFNGHLPTTALHAWYAQIPPTSSNLTLYQNYLDGWTAGCATTDTHQGLDGNSLNTNIINDPSLKITNFDLNVTDISLESISKNFVIKGDAGATFTMTVTNGANEYYNFTTDTFGSAHSRLLWEKIDSTGIYNGTILYPSVTSDDTYTINLTAEPYFETSFDTSVSESGAPVILTQKQYADSTATFSLATTSYGSYYNSLPSNVVITRSPHKSGISTAEISWTTTLSSRSFVINRQPLETDFKVTKTQTVDGATSSSKSVVLDDIFGLVVGMEITAVSSGSLTASTEVTYIDYDTKTLTISQDNTFADGITLTFSGYGTDGTKAVYGSSFKMNNLKVVLSDVDILTDDTSSNATIPLANTNGLLAITTQTVDGDVSELVTVTLDSVANLRVGQKLVACSACALVGEPVIESIDGKVLTLNSKQKFNDGETLSFANTEISGIGVGCSGTKTTYVHSVSSGASVVARAGGSDVTNDIENGQTIKFTKSSRSATITADVELQTIGNTDYTTTLQLDNILTVIA